MRNGEDRKPSRPESGGQPEQGGGAGKEYWRSLDELANTPEFRALVESEFPGLAGDLLSPRTRRAFLKIMGASLGVAGLASCRWPKELILPFAHRPEGRTPGVPQQYATAMELGGAAIGLLVTSFDGRPIKIEGNPLHPTSRGTATALAQASLLELYDPDRSRQPIRREGGQEIAQSWDDFVAFAVPHFAALRVARGRGLAVLSGESSSPSVARLRARFAEVLPEAAWYEWEPIGRDAERQGTRSLFGEALRPHYRFGAADVILCLDADPLFDHPAALMHARDFASRRRADDGTMNRLYAAEAVVSLTGAMADHRAGVTSRDVANVAASLVLELRELGVSFPGEVRPILAELESVRGRNPAQPFVAAAARDLARSRTKGLVVAGSRQPASVHLLAHMVNLALGSVGTTVTFTAEPGGSQPSSSAQIAAVTAAAGAGRIETLLILGGNPVHDAPADLALGASLRKIPTTIHLSGYDDESSHLCRWQVPGAHYLETWGDVRAWDGTISVQQPLIEALYGGRSPAEILALTLGERATGGYEIVRATLAGLTQAADFEATWRRTLNDGVLAGSAWPATKPRLQVASGSAGELNSLLRESGTAEGAEVIFCADARIHDGRFANNAWLQELPDPLTKITWDNAATLSPATAGKLGVSQGDVVKVSRAGRTIEVAAYVMPGQADGTVALPLGYGRTAAGKVGDGVGFDAYPLRTSDALRFAGAVTVEKTGRSHTLACTHDHFAIDKVGFEARGKRIGEFVREGTLAEYLANPAFARERFEEPVSLPLFNPQKYGGEHQWAMSIDLSACIGCNACVIACQAENNTPVVGKEQVVRGREMHWIRVDRYFEGRPEAPGIAFQPLACQHCENAPCEEVCPVAATVHSDEGLNEQVYNRCVGTRYCSNNCPYKVRRFNFFNYFLHVPEIEKMVFNPEVTVRGRGVMEKCTFCIQRIEAVKIAAGNERRPIRDGEIVPACAQTCPTQAIVFGDLKDPGSRVSKLHAHGRSYGILGALDTRPRNLYMARLRNPSSRTGESG
ncbi:MAG TPA: TAT-variant-translocated molybdopterin oxidoreductase [Thermoanaerobaculaceae bacterium]|nr:TAT-variant-translocated molybdopterin oxidoreductase [Thermoanaerobaculaceae bacterium]